MRLPAIGTDSGVRHAVAAAWPSGERLRVVRELAAALRHLHSGAACSVAAAGGSAATRAGGAPRRCRVVVLHRDLKPNNIGLTGGRTVKLLDFGLAVGLEASEPPPPPPPGASDEGGAAADAGGGDGGDGGRAAEHDTYQLTGSTGTRRYMAPEVALGAEYGVPADVYSYAITAWEVRSARPRRPGRVALPPLLLLPAARLAIGRASPFARYGLVVLAVIDYSHESARPLRETVLRAPLPRAGRALNGLFFFRRTRGPRIRCLRCAAGRSRASTAQRTTCRWSSRACGHCSPRSGTPRSHTRSPLRGPQRPRSAQARLTTWSRFSRH